MNDIFTSFRLSVLWAFSLFFAFSALQGVEAVSAPSADSKAEASLKSGSWLDDWSTQTYMLGDWGGWRPKLASEYGVNFESVYFSAVPWNLSGGLNRGAVYEGVLLSALDVDMEKLAGMTGGSLHVSSLWIHGQAFSKNFVGDSNVVSLIDLAKSLRLWELTYEQKFFQDHLSIRFGQMAIDRDFIVPELYSTLGSITLLNQAFFYPTIAFGVFDRPFFPVEDHALASTPYATPGIRVKGNWSQDLYVQAAVYGGKPDFSYHGTEFNLSDESGALSYFEAGYHHHMQPGDEGLPGSYKMGGYYHTDDFSDNEALMAAFGLPNNGISHAGNYGFYALAEQMVFREQEPSDPARQGLVAFARFTYAPPDRNLYEWGADGGLVYFGPVPGRDYDTVGLAFSYLAASSELVDIQRRINAAIPGALPDGDYEASLELNYKAQLTAWMTLQTSLQRVFHPGAKLAQDVPDALAVVVQSSLRF